MSTTARLPLPGTAFHSEPFAPSRSFSTSSMKVTTAPATKRDVHRYRQQNLFADDPHLATTLYLTYTHQNYWDRGSRIVTDYRWDTVFPSRESRISANLAAYRSEYQGKRDDSLSLSFQCHGAMAAPWIMNYRTAVTRPAKWFRIPITAIVIIRGVCAQGFPGRAYGI